MFALDLPVAWQAELWSQQQTTTHWHIDATTVPKLTELGCTEVVTFGALSWCEHDASLWVLFTERGTLWLSRYRRSAQVPQYMDDWRGSPLQQFSAEGQQISVHLSPHHPQQFHRLMRFRFAHRKPQIRELSHGRFYLSLQEPHEDVFIYAQQQGSLLVSALKL